MLTPTGRPEAQAEPSISNMLNPTGRPKGQVLWTRSRQNLPFLQAGRRGSTSNSHDFKQPELAGRAGSTNENVDLNSLNLTGRPGSTSKNVDFTHA